MSGEMVAGGYRVGDVIGIGTVIAPREVNQHDNYKAVTVDTNRDGRASLGDDTVLVSLPRRGPAAMSVPLSGETGLTSFLGAWAIAAGTMAAQPVKLSSRAKIVAWRAGNLPTAASNALRAKVGIGIALAGVAAIGYAIYRHQSQDRAAAIAGHVPNLVAPRQ